MSPLSLRVDPILCSLALTLLVACGGHGDPSTGTGGNAALLEVACGRLVDVYGLADEDGLRVPALWRRDVLIGPDVQAGGAAGPRGPVFLPANADSLQPRLLIPESPGSTAFLAAVDRLDDLAPIVTPMRIGQVSRTWSVVPRNAALRLRFARPLGIDDGFFRSDGAGGGAVGIRNSEAVQLLEITGTDRNGEITTRPLAVRIAVAGQDLIVDPVLLGSEAAAWQSAANPTGLPEAPDRTAANLRLLLPLTGPLAISGLQADRDPGLRGVDARGGPAIVRDFRSGNRADDNAEMARGFVRDTESPRLLGQVPMRLAGVRTAAAGLLDLRLWKDGVVHEIDAGDVVEVSTGSEANPIAAEVLADPGDDRGHPEQAMVSVRVRAVAGLLPLDPTRRTDWPANGTTAEQEAFLREHAPRVLLQCPFQVSRRIAGRLVRDDPRWFVQFAPGSQNSAASPVDDVQVFAGASLRFSKPLAPESLRPLEALFFGTRNLLDPAERLAFAAAAGTGPITDAKFRAPHLIGARATAEDGSLTRIRLQPLLGFYLDETMRAAAARGEPFSYFLHVVAGADGVEDFTGQPLDLGNDDPEGDRYVVVPFTVDARVLDGRRAQPDNLVAYACRRFADLDEDEQPSLYRPDELPLLGAPPNPRAQPIADLFGNHVLLDGYLRGRPTTRVRQIVDNLNQVPAPLVTSPLAWCPPGAIGVNTATTPFGQGIQNPLNPFGARLQAVWREIDLSLSRLDPADFDLDVERVYWAPFRGTPLLFDRFDSTSLYLGHSEWRPEPCTGTALLPIQPNSGLKADFNRNYVFNPTLEGAWRESGADPHLGYAERPLPIEPAAAIAEPNGQNRYLPLPALQRPFFVFRDQRVMEQGGAVGEPDLSIGAQTISDTVAARAFPPYIPSPWLNGRGDGVVAGPAGLTAVQPRWNNGRNQSLTNRPNPEASTGGLLGSIALPLLIDFQTLCDDPALPTGNPFRAYGTSGWQIALTVQTDPRPAFRAFSGGRRDLGNGSLCVSPGSPAWGVATGGFNLAGAATFGLDNSLYWIMIDFVKRQTVTTAGFVDLLDPHRVPLTVPDPRLRPRVPAGALPRFAWSLDPPAASAPPGTTITAEFRAAGQLDPAPWLWREENVLSTVGGGYAAPDERNVPLDPRKACDAHIRKLDERDGGRRWTRFYHRTVTAYTTDPGELIDPAFLRRFASGGTSFGPADVRYVNWRLVLTNAVDTQAQASPAVDSVCLAWRWVAAQ